MSSATWSASGALQVHEHDQLKRGRPERGSGATLARALWGARAPFFGSGGPKQKPERTQSEGSFLAGQGPVVNNLLALRVSPMRSFLPSSPLSSRLRVPLIRDRGTLHPLLDFFFLPCVRVPRGKVVRASCVRGRALAYYGSSVRFRGQTCVLGQLLGEAGCSVLPAGRAAPPQIH